MRLTGEFVWVGKGRSRCLWLLARWLTGSRYIDTNPLNTDPTNKYHGTTAEFKAMWTAVAKAVDRSKVKMFWSPVGPFKAGDTVATLNNDWYPGDDVVDLVGLDAVRPPFNPLSSFSLFSKDALVLDFF